MLGKILKKPDSRGLNKISHTDALTLPTAEGVYRGPRGGREDQCPAGILEKIPCPGNIQN